MVRVAGLAVAAGLLALANGGSALAEPPGDSCSPAVMMRAQADQMTVLSDYLAAHPDAGNAGSPTDAAAALRMAAAMRNIQADMAASCGMTMDQLLPGGTPPVLPEGMPTVLPGGMPPLLPGGMPPGH
jgi:hypothetical protein